MNLGEIESFTDKIYILKSYRSIFKVINYNNWFFEYNARVGVYLKGIFVHIICCTHTLVSLISVARDTVSGEWN